MKLNRIMSLLQGNKVGVILLFALLFTQCAVAQNGTSEELRQDADIVIDYTLGSKGNMMTMEEEIEVYMKLSEEDNQAIFHPNPSGGIIWLEHNMKGDVSLELLNSSLKVLFKAKNMQVHQLDLHGYPPGEYSIVIYYEEGKKSYSLLIK